MNNFEKVTNYIVLCGQRTKTVMFFATKEPKSKGRPTAGAP